MSNILSKGRTLYTCIRCNEDKRPEAFDFRTGKVCKACKLARVKSIQRDKGKTERLNNELLGAWK